MKKKLFTTLLFLSLVMMARADRFGQIIVSNCYQWFMADYRGGTYNVIGNTVVFGSSNPLDFNSVDIYRMVDDRPVYYTWIRCGETMILETGQQYMVTQPGAFSGPVYLNMVEPHAVMGDYNNDGCLAFGEPYQFTIQPPIEGFCGFQEISYTGPTGIVHDNGYLLEDDGYCTPPDGQAWAGGPRCIDLRVTLTIWPCRFDAECPNLTFNSTARVCCNNCRPYGPTEDEQKTLAGEEITLNIYPNPATDKLMIQSQEAGVLEIYNTVGQQIRTITVEEAGEMFIDVSSWQQGQYICRFIAPGKQTRTHKLIVMH